jgi:DeoR family transcriptional regulator, catabolite repression regulator
MALNDRQIKILQVVNAGNTTGEAIADAMGSSMQMLSYYIGQMVEDGYLKAARVYDNELRDFVVVRAYLTPEGQDIVNQNVASVAAPTPVVAAVSEPIVNEPIVSEPIATTPEGSEVTTIMPTLDHVVEDSFTAPSESVQVTNRSIDYTLVGESLRVMGESIAQLPDDWREMAEVYLDDLQNEVYIAYRRRPARLKAYLLSLLRMLLPIADKIPQGEQFIQQARVVSQELQIPVKLPGDS